MTRRGHDRLPGLMDSDHGPWRVKTDRAAWVIDLDARIVRHEILGMDAVHTPGRAWILVRLHRCVVGEALDWVLTQTPGGSPLPPANEPELVIGISQLTSPSHRSTSLRERNGDEQ